MANDDYLYDQIERSQREQTRRRRTGRSQRRRLYWLTSFVMLGILACAAPSAICRSTIGRSMVTRVGQSYGLDVTAEQIEVGWITPLRLSNLQIRGDAGSEITVDRVDIDLTAVDFLRLPTDLGPITVRGVHCRCALSDGRCSLEDDFNAILEPSDNQKSFTTQVTLQDVSVSIEETSSGRAWQVTQSGADIDVTPERVDGSFMGVLTEPGGSAGSLQGSIEWIAAGGQPIASENSVSDPNEPTAPQRWRLDLESESLPLSVATLVRTRFPELAKPLPMQIHGDATGGLELVGTADGTVHASVRQLNVRNFRAADPGTRVWNNRLATVDGDLLLAGNRVIGRQLKASADFASATFDGAFSRSFSLVGANDNPLKWLEAIDGTAQIDIDLAAMDRSLPGMIPLRQGAELVSGRIVALVDSTVDSPSGQTSPTQSRLTVRSEPLRARARGRAVVIDPIEFTAVVSKDGQSIRADQFEWTSTFGSVVGRGDSRSGSADVDLDFGRLISMIRPIIETSESSLAGRVQANIQWNASPDDVWTLRGSGSGSNLVVTLPSGQRMERQSIRGSVEAIGRWGGRSLSELSKAEVQLNSRGLELQIALVDPIQNPSADSVFGLTIRADGRVEILTETLAAWLPEQFYDAAGQIQGRMLADVSRTKMRLSSANIEITEPRIAIADRYFSQPRLAVRFDGQFDWPEQHLEARTLTVASDALSLTAQGTASETAIDLDLDWRVKLEHLQSSLRRRIAQQRSQPVQRTQFVASSPIASSDPTRSWRLTGELQGQSRVIGDRAAIELTGDIVGSDLTLIETNPAELPVQTAGGAVYGPSNRPSTVVWSERNLKVDGQVRYDRPTGRLATDGLQVAGDWFATTVSGTVVTRRPAYVIELSGPTRLLMDDISRRLAVLSGFDVQLQGVHEAPLRMSAEIHPDDGIRFEALTEVGWESGQMAGLPIGSASIPVRVTDTDVELSRSTIPVGEGRIYLAGQMHYPSHDRWVRFERGPLAESIRLNPEITNRWIKYVAPLAAAATQVQGTIGLELDEGLVYLDDPARSRLKGRIDVAEVTMSPGPISSQILSGIDQIRLFSRSLATAAEPAANEGTWVTMPPQRIDFLVDSGIVHHERLYVEIDRATVMTSGRVSLDGRLEMIAQVPLDESWLGNDLKTLAGQPIPLPIGGTLSQPSLDTNGIQQLATQWGANAVQETTENIIREGLGKLLGR